MLSLSTKCFFTQIIDVFLRMRVPHKKLSIFGGHGIIKFESPVLEIAKNYWTKFLDMPMNANAQISYKYVIDGHAKSGKCDKLSLEFRCSFCEIPREQIPRGLDFWE